jgi:hypothetical protein
VEKEAVSDLRSEEHFSFWVFGFWSLGFAIKFSTIGNSNQQTKTEVQKPKTNIVY